MILKKLLLSSLVLVSAHASVFKLADVFINEAAVKLFVKKTGANSAGVSKMSQYIGTSVNSITKGMGDGDLYTALKKLPVERSDLAKKNAIIKVLSKDSEKVSNEEFVSAVNDLIYLSNKYGYYKKKSVTCSLCVGEDLSLIGYKTSIRVVSDNDTVVSKRLADLPTSNKRLRDLNRKNLRQLGAVDTVAELDQQEYRAFGLFLELTKKGKKEHREFGEAVLKFNTVGGKPVLNGSRAPSSLWKLSVSNLPKEKLQKFTAMLEVASKQKDPAARKDVLFDQLFKEAGSNSDEVSAVRKLKSNNCFFNK